MESKDLAVRESGAITHPENLKTLTVFARTPQEMNIAQGQMVRWSVGKLAEVREEMADLQENVAIAVKNGWRSTTLKRQLSRAVARVEFYDKIRAALEAGYCIVPNFPIDVFAIRTERRSPKGNMSIVDTPPLRSPRIAAQESESPALGEGQYVSTQAVVRESLQNLPTEAGKPQRTHIHVWADAFGAVDFPFTFAQPAVFEATQKAMAERLFDELGVSPTQKRASGDPMVIGRIYAPYHQHWQRNDRSISFVVAWFLRPERDLNF